jgi:hypothetical protein
MHSKGFHLSAAKDRNTGELDLESTTTRRAGGLDFPAKAGKCKSTSVLSTVHLQPGAKYTVYKDIGYDVHLEPFHPEEEPGCTECMKLQADRYKTIYIRNRRNSDDNGILADGGAE